VAEYGDPIELAPGLRATFFNARHILGSASILIEAQDAGERPGGLFGRPRQCWAAAPAAVELQV
jgi:Cft2 family RNA processing exonuclease